MVDAFVRFMIKIPVMAYIFAIAGSLVMAILLTVSLAHNVDMTNVTKGWFLKHEVTDKNREDSLRCYPEIFGISGMYKIEKISKSIDFAD